MIREAVYEDLDAIVALGYEARERSWYRHIPPDEPKFRKLTLRIMTSQQHLALVAERGGMVVGVLLAVSDEIFFSRAKSVTDILTYVRPAAAGDGARMARYLIRWAKARPSVCQIVLSISGDIVDPGRTGSMYESLGLARQGGTFAWYRGVHD